VYTYRLERRVSDLEALLDHLGLASGVTLVLHDWGGMIGMAAALRRPERISRVVLLNTAAFLLPEGKGLPLRLRLLHKGPLGPLLVQGLSGFARGAVYMASMRGLAPAVRAGYLAPYDSWANRIATLRFVQDIPLEEEHPSWALAKWVDDRVASLAHQPTLICWGERDFVFDRDFLAQWLKRLPGAEVHSFPGAGHYVMEDECEAIIGLVKAFLRVNRT
jgi:haloalkane dehalogenase